MAARNAGERNGLAKLNEKAVQHIRRVCRYDPAVGYRPGTVRRMADRYGVTASAVRMIASNKAWRHVK